MSNKAVFYIVVNVLIVVIGYFALRFAVLSSPEPKRIPPTINDVMRDFRKAKREGRVEVHHGLSPEFIEKMNRRRWIYQGGSK